MRKLFAKFIARTSPDMKGYLIGSNGDIYPFFYSDTLYHRGGKIRKVTNWFGKGNERGTYVLMDDMKLYSLYTVYRSMCRNGSEVKLVPKETIVDVVEYE